MTSKFNQRWIIAGTIWLAALFMTHWNFTKIESVAKVRESNERMRKENLFQHRNADKLVHIQNLYRSYFKPVASVKLGFESVRSPLHALAALFGMENVKIDPQIAQATHEQIPFTMRMTGDYQKAMGFASALMKYPYISIAHSRISVLNPKGKAEIEMELKFQFRIELPDESPSGSLQAFALPSCQGVSRQ